MYSGTELVGSGTVSLYTQKSQHTSNPVAPPAQTKPHELHDALAAFALFLPLLLPLLVALLVELLGRRNGLVARGSA
jgi:hypothetical protein